MPLRQHERAGTIARDIVAGSMCNYSEQRRKNESKKSPNVVVSDALRHIRSILGAA